MVDGLRSADRNCIFFLTCIVCKEEISAERIDAAPATRLCTAHAQEIEKYGGEFTLHATQERTSKPGSLKLNYGGISTTSARNQPALEKPLDAYEGKWFEK